MLRAEAFGHRAIPDAARRAILRNLLEEVVMRVEEKRKPGREIVDREPAAQRPFHILHAVVESEGELLQRRRASLADVIARDGNRIETRRVESAELEGIHHQPHGRGRRIDVLLLRDVFLQDVVLQGAGDLLPVRALLFRDRQIHRPQHRGGRIDRHRHGDLFKIDAGEENLHIFQRVDGDAAFADLAFTLRIVGVVPINVGRSKATERPSPPCASRYL